MEATTYLKQNFENIDSMDKVLLVSIFSAPAFENKTSVI